CTRLLPCPADLLAVRSEVPTSALLLVRNDVLARDRYLRTAVSSIVSRMRIDLPEPSRDEREHSERLLLLIRDEIVRAGGAIDFSRYMELALYTPGLGYYSAGAQKFGASGDFVTAPELGFVFARCLARALAPTLHETRGEVLELGPGSGALAAELLL